MRLIMRIDIHQAKVGVPVYAKVQRMEARIVDGDGVDTVANEAVAHLSFTTVALRVAGAGYAVVIPEVGDLGARIVLPRDPVVIAIGVGVAVVWIAVITLLSPGPKGVQSVPSVEAKFGIIHATLGATGVGRA